MEVLFIILVIIIFVLPFVLYFSSRLSDTFEIKGKLRQNKAREKFEKNMEDIEKDELEGDSFDVSKVEGEAFFFSADNKYKSCLAVSSNSTVDFTFLELISAEIKVVKGPTSSRSYKATMSVHSYETTRVYGISVLLKLTKDPQEFTIICYSGDCQIDSRTYDKHLKEAQDIVDICKHIISGGKALLTDKQVQPAVEAQVTSSNDLHNLGAEHDIKVTEELLKVVELYEKQLITKEEYDLMKADILTQLKLKQNNNIQNH